MEGAARTATATSSTSRRRSVEEACRVDVGLGGDSWQNSKNVFFSLSSLFSLLGPVVVQVLKISIWENENGKRGKMLNSGLSKILPKF